ncbi:malonate decarboxylase holo-[acyl-carrier-protein] synthase [Methylobacterium nigriterrae]|uniref:malonate decarboxylase holo-[acyl-carrier-protein] synthase n=1 Tax=Methylobacterium nigriterrae TaxID=3127512 RepID=UPI003D675616
MPAVPDGHRRHDLLDVEPAAWAAALAGRPDLAGAPHLAGWAERGFPVIVRRRHPGEASARVPVGLPLPPADGKRRIGLGLAPEAVRPRAPVTVARALDAAPEAWHPTLRAVIGLGERHGLMPRVFGGLLWQSLTGLPYLSATSDLDLLWPVSGPIARGFLDAIAAIEARAPMRLDGEILLADGSGLNWRELRAPGEAGTVLAKHRDGLALRAVGPVLLGADA